MPTIQLTTDVSVQTNDFGTFTHRTAALVSTGTMPASPLLVSCET